MKKYDTLIIGGGPAGLSAAIYTCRKGLKTGIIAINIGGQINLTSYIENYPGIDSMPGPQLVEKIHKQVLKFGAEVIIGEANKLEKKGKEFIVTLNNKKKYTSKTIIIASGKIPRKLNIPGEDKFMGKGVVTCVVCDGPLFENKIVSVVGGGNSAFEAAQFLSGIAKKVYLINRSDKFRADEVLIGKVKKLKNVEILINSQLKEIKGDRFVEEILVETEKNKKILKTQGVFVEIGYTLDTSWLKNNVKLNKYGEVKIDSNCNTSLPGVYAAGDVTTIPYKQIVISAGEGAKAGLEAYKYIKGDDSKTVDWA